MESSVSLPAASSAALREIDSTTRRLYDFLDDIPLTPHLDLGPLLLELYELRRLLDRESSWDDDRHHDQQLASSLAWAVRSSADVCTQIRQILIQTRDQKRQRWSLGHGPGQLEALTKVLESIRRTAKLVFDALEDVESSSRLLDELDHLRQDIAPANCKIHGLLATCLDDVERHIQQGQRLHAPSLQEMANSLRDPAFSRPAVPTHQRSAPQPPTLQTIQDEDYYFEKRNVKRDTLVTPLSPPLSTLLPLASPPPTKPLPPIPLPKSPTRAHRLSTASSIAPEIPKKSRARARARAFSDLTHDSRFSSASSAATRHSVLSQSSLSGGKVSRRSTTSFNDQASLAISERDTVLSVNSSDHHVFDLVPIQRLDVAAKGGVHGPVFAIETSPDSTILASRHGKFHINLSDASTGEQLATLKVPFYVQMQMRSRDFFIRSHHVISETLRLVAIATGFGQTIEIWDWVKNKKVKTINDAYRWAAVRDPVFESRCFPLATYRSDDDVINLYPISDDHRKTKKKNPPLFGKPRAIELRKARLPHMPKLPELAYSATAPLLVAAAGPRPPRMGSPPPEHAALLMAWQLDDGVVDTRPYKFLHHRQLENSLPLFLATYGSVVVSIWEPAHFRTIGRPGAWQVEPVAVTERTVLVWDFGSGEDVNGSKDTTRTYRIPNVLSCVSPDCRFVAYCDSGTRKAAQQKSHQVQQQDEAALVLLDAMSGRELWRVGGSAASRCQSNTGVRNSTWSGGSCDTKGSGNSWTSNRKNNVEVFTLAGNLDKVTDLAFSGDGTRLFVGYIDGRVGVFEVREGIGMAV